MSDPSAHKPSPEHAPNPTGDKTCLACMGRGNRSRWDMSSQTNKDEPCYFCDGRGYK